MCFEDPLTHLVLGKRGDRTYVYWWCNFISHFFSSSGPTWMTWKISCHFSGLVFCILWVVQISPQPSCTSESLLDHGSTTQWLICYPFPSQTGVWLSLLDTELLFQWLTVCWGIDFICREHHILCHTTGFEEFPTFRIQYNEYLGEIKKEEDREIANLGKTHFKD